MSIQKATTRLIEYVPYRHRNERVAIGLIATLPSGEVRAHLAMNLTKVSAVHPSCDIEALRSGMQGIACELSKEPDLIDRYVSGFGAIRFAISQGFITFNSPEDYERAIQWSLNIAADPIGPTASLEA